MGLLASGLLGLPMLSLGAVVAYMGRYRMGSGFIYVGLFGMGCVGAGFKIYRDSCDPTLPAQLRPSAWSAVAAFVLGGLAILSATAWLFWRY